MSAALPRGAADGDLLAQATTEPGSASPATSPAVAAPAKKKEPLPKQSKGVGNLSNLARGAGNRGWQIYSLVLAIGTIVMLYMGLRASGGGRRSG